METITLKVSGASDMQAYAVRPEGAPTKGIIVVQEAFGITDHIKHVTERFGGQGYLAVAPEMFHRTAEPGRVFATSDYASGALKEHFEAITPGGLMADVDASIEWLVSQGVPREKIAIIGFCLGGRTSFLADATYPLAAAIAFYGGGIDQMLDKVPELNAPIYFFWGGKDQGITAEKRQAIIDAMTASGKPFEYKVFEDADHAFMRDIDPTHYHEQSAKEAWVLVDQFLADNLV
jgi:carboxymethylenebutenolidase